jgi:phosphatidylglycerol---prolipoprotein diacylglyceryl transferase
MNPLIIETRYFVIHSLWLFFTIALIIGTYAFVKLAGKNGLKIQFLSANAWKLLIWALIGSRIAYVAENYFVYFYSFSSDAILQIFYVWDQGLSIWGALLAFLIAFYYLCKKDETQDFMKWLDAFVPAMLIGLAIGSIGAFLDGINYGHETNFPWGVNFENPAIKYAVPIHPTQIYAFLYSLAIGIGLILIAPIKKIKNLELPGFIGLLGLATYGFLHFLEEFLRGDDTLLILGIRTPQILSALLAISAGTFLVMRYNEHAKKSKK